MCTHFGQTIVASNCIRADSQQYECRWMFGDICRWYLYLRWLPQSWAADAYLWALDNNEWHQNDKSLPAVGWLPGWLNWTELNRSEENRTGLDGLSFGLLEPWVLGRSCHPRQSNVITFICNTRNGKKRPAALLPCCSQSQLLSCNAHAPNLSPRGTPPCWRRSQLYTNRWQSSSGWAPQHRPQPNAKF